MISASRSDRKLGDLPSHRGDSGMKKIRVNWMMEGKPCNTEGILHDQEPLIEKVPKVAHAATMEPRYQVVL